MKVVISAGGWGTPRRGNDGSPLAGQSFAFLFSSPQSKVRKAKRLDKQAGKHRDRDSYSQRPERQQVRLCNWRNLALAIQKEYEKHDWKMQDVEAVRKINRYDRQDFGKCRLQQIQRHPERKQPETYQRQLVQRTPAYCENCNCDTN